MNSEQSKIAEVLNSLAAAVVNAIRNGSDADRKVLAKTLHEMDAGMPGISEDTAAAKEFLQALVSLLEGMPVSSDALSAGYKDIYARIVQKASEPEEKRSHAHGPDRETKEFLTQLAATVVLVMRKDDDEDKKALAARLREIRAALPPEKEDAGRFVLALASLLEGAPVPPEALSPVYSGLYKNIVGSINKKS